MKKKSSFVLITFFIVFILSACSQTPIDPDQKEGESATTPTFLSIKILDTNKDQILPDDTGWTVLPSKIIIAVEYEGRITKADFYTTPTGTETSSKQTLIGTLEVNEETESEIAFEWQPPTDFMGYLTVVLYDDELPISSEGNFLIKLLRANEDGQEAEDRINITADQMGITLSVPSTWEDIAIIETTSDAEAPSAGGSNTLLFRLYEKVAYTENKSMGLVWSLNLFTNEAFEDTFGEVDLSEIIGIADYCIGSDDEYVYLLSLPSDVQFLEDNQESEAQYRQLQIESQAVLEDFLNTYHITMNEKCPDSPVFQMSAS